MLKRKTRPNITTKISKGQPRKSVEEKRGHEFKMLEGMEATNKGNEARKFME
jgi:hypothetical protein